ncbi:HD domain-containing protein [Candidatus Woesearchaeota archaeon]|nr:HD domain-containing protein [Candidatus Woesearchaeota archaeon]
MNLIKAFDNKGSKGRKTADNPVASRKPYMTDFQRIIETKAYRRLADKTQAFSLPEHSHIRTRKVHTDEVISTSMKISELLGLNTELCMAIAAGHDIGHAPYGHLGEKVLAKIGKKPFHHSVFGPVVAQEIENRGKGLNLSYETLEGMLLHARGKKDLAIDYSKPAEYTAVMLADKISYTLGDYSDASYRVGYFPKSQEAFGLAEKIEKYLGKKTNDRREACVKALVEQSKKDGMIAFSEGPEHEAFKELRSMLYSQVYPSIQAHVHETALTDLYQFIKTDSEFVSKYNGFDPVLFITLLTDKEVTYFGTRQFISKKNSLEDIEHFGAFEVLPELKDKRIDYSEPGLDWLEKG